LRRGLRIFAARFGIALVTTTLLMGVGVLAVNYVIDAKIGAVTRVSVAVAPAPAQGANFLVIGSDSRAFVGNDPTAQQQFGSAADTGGQRSDTIMVVHVLPNAKKTLLVSIPRDTLVNIPGVGEAKINAAYDLGPDKLIATLQSNFGIEINHYLEVDFKSFQGVVDAIGTVPVYFPYKAYDDYTGLDVSPGCVKLNGTQSLAYVRSRELQYLSKTAGLVFADFTPDIGRIARQQEFIRTLAGLAVQKSLANPLTANAVATQVLKYLTVDQGLTKGDIFSIIDAFRTVNTNDTRSLDFETFPWKEGPAFDGQSVLYPGIGWQAVAARLEDFSGNTTPPASIAPSSVSVKVLDATDRAGVGEATIAELAKLGFHATTTGTDPRGRVTLSEVRYRPDSLQQATEVLNYLDPPARLVADPKLTGVDVEIVLGTDFKGVLVPAAPTTPASSTPTTVAGTALSPTTSTTTPTTTPPTMAGTTSSLPATLTPKIVQSQSLFGPPAANGPPCT
jgi:LCP family protein required for cell wall assembly